ncbi:hypothetical protein MKX03_008787 [Papaver bracteatum]|nr:hypothetical protein MKX03_008787 [Papaver bracteatum]
MEELGEDLGLGYDSRTHASKNKRKLSNMEDLGASVPDLGYVLITVLFLTFVDSRAKRVEALIEIQRFNIVSGVSESDGEEEKGVPNFWLNAMKTNEVLTKKITEWDEGPLKYLIDIKWFRIGKLEKPKGFKLDFYFDVNPYLDTAVLTKIYHVTHDEEPILEKVGGTEIEWKYGKNVTRKVDWMVNDQYAESFFDFFNPPLVHLDEVADVELQNKMYQDYYVGSTIRDKIIPYAVSWFTGEARVIYYEDSDMDAGVKRPDSQVKCSDDSLRDRSFDLHSFFKKFNKSPQTEKPEKEELSFDEEDLGYSLSDLCYASCRQGLKRYDIVNGVTEEVEAVEKGVPNFWLKAMKTVLKAEITETDEGPLENLQDIKFSRIGAFEGFKLDFIFRDNPYFNNAVLTKTYRMAKTYHMNDDDEPIFKEIQGTGIEWKYGKILVKEVVSKEPKRGSDRWRINVRNMKSFFSFFNSPLIAEDINDIDGKTVEELQKEIDQDYDVW